MKKTKILLSLSLFWIVLLGYLVWANGINRRAKIRSNWSHQEIKTELIRLGFFE